MIKPVSSVALLLVALFGVAAAFPTETRRIVNGTTTTIDRIPFQVSILQFNSQWCGASILDQNTLLTAAHCFDYYFDYPDIYPISAYSTRVGSSYWADGGEQIALQSVVRHESYDPSTYDFDVALVKLASPLTYSANTQPVELAATTGSLVAGQDVQVSGWGRLVVSRRLN